MTERDRRGFLKVSGVAGFGLLGCGGNPAGGTPSPDAGATTDTGAVDAPGPEATPDGGGATPWWLQGNYGPVADELEATSLEVLGALPPELDGVYLRNGPNPRSGRSGHWFVGDGMLHGVRLQGGRALWYRNRYLQTSLYRGMPFGRSGGFPDVRDTAGNTALALHAGRLLALYEASLPLEVRADLSTVGLYDFAGMLEGPMSAHPKSDPATGELFFHGYGVVPPYVKVHRVDAQGRHQRVTNVMTRGATMVHEFQLTPRWMVVLDLPIVFDLGTLARSPLPYRWRDDYPARVGLVPREGDGSARWFDIEPCYIFHTFNAFEEGERVVLEGCRHPRLWVDGPDLLASEPMPHRWTLDLSTGRAQEQRLTDQLAEFPQVASAVRGRPHRYGYALNVGRSPDGVHLGDARAYLKHDRVMDRWTRHDLGEGRQPDEPTFVPRPGGRSEDDGWIFGFVYDRAGDRSELVVLDAMNFTAPAVARVRLPRRVPHGFHGLWVPAMA
ncbi:MAG: carotenoid oxygenase family protein [Deltaproteobacteria bacterium]|nr:carotenoid oxygenase family protein [Deltaproteobacteria bacterium]